jgi:hypothetical protein
MEEERDSQPLVYDTDSGRFYEQKVDVMREGKVVYSDTENAFNDPTFKTATSNSNTKETPSPSMSKISQSKPNKESDYSAEDLFDKFDPKEKMSKFPAPDNLDLLREKYSKDIEIKNKAKRDSLLSIESNSNINSDKNSDCNSDNNLDRKNSDDVTIESMIDENIANGRAPVDLNIGILKFRVRIRVMVRIANGRAPVDLNVGKP